MYENYAKVDETVIFRLRIVNKKLLFFMLVVNLLVWHFLL
jgi:hypothetical protein